MLNYAERTMENNLSKSKLNRYLNGKHLVAWSNAVSCWNEIGENRGDVGLLGGFPMQL